MKALIITTAVGYRPADIWNFLSSAVRHCPTASIIAIVHPRDMAELSICCEHFPSLTLYPVNTARKDIQHTRGFIYKVRRGLARLRSWSLSRIPPRLAGLTLADERPSPLGLSSQELFILNRRFFLARHLLRCQESSPDAVLLTDSRDVVFQADPFLTLNQGCHTGQEFNLIRHSPINAHWIRTTYGETGFETLADYPILCSGVTIGDTHSVLSYLDLFCAEIGHHAINRRTAMIPIWDQAYHNMILRKHPSESMILMAWDSLLATVGEVPPAYISVQGNSCIYVSDCLPAILHQYDRHPTAAAAISALYPLPVLSGG